MDSIVSTDAKIVKGHRPRGFLDLSLYFLVIANVFSIYFALVEHWNLTTVMMVYWAQSVIIGVFNFVRILTLKEFSTVNFKINNQPVAPTKSTKIFTAFFFAFHYGIFHLAYLAFVLDGIFSAQENVLSSGDVGQNISYIAVGIVLFFLNHAFSFFYNHRADEEKRVPNIGRLMFFPYVRILPMHLTIILGGFVGAISRSSTTLLLFLVLKMIADVLTHYFEHIGVEDSPKIKVL